MLLQVSGSQLSLCVCVGRESVHMCDRGGGSCGNELMTICPLSCP